MAPTPLTNGTAAAHDTDSSIDSLYAWWPPAPPAPAPLPEAAFSLTLKGTLDGVEALFTVRGATAAEFKTNLAAVRGLLGQPQAPAQPASREQGWCAIHNVSMKQTTKDGRSWYSHKVPDGRWCKGR